MIRRKYARQLAPKLLRSAGYQDSEMNRETLQRTAVDMYRKAGIQVFEVED